jgi:uncharacterized protein (TIGR00730 family)
MVSKVCIYSASSDKVDKVYFDAAERLSLALLHEHVAINYGGGWVGLMGKLAEVYLSGNGSITGIIPLFMMEEHWGHPKVKDMVVVANMHERKKLMIQDVDAVIALPGGCGTVEELMETITLKQLGLFIKPIIIVNTNGFYDPLLELFEKMIVSRFMRDEHKQIWTVINDPGIVVEAINNSPAWTSAAIKMASV